MTIMAWGRQLGERAHLTDAELWCTQMSARGQSANRWLGDDEQRRSSRLAGLTWMVRRSPPWSLKRTPRDWCADRARAYLCVPRARGPSRSSGRSIGRPRHGELTSPVTNSWPANDSAGLRGEKTADSRDSQRGATADVGHVGDAHPLNVELLWPSLCRDGHGGATAPLSGRHRPRRRVRRGRHLRASASSRS